VHCVRHFRHKPLHTACDGIFANIWAPLQFMFLNMCEQGSLDQLRMELWQTNVVVAVSVFQVAGSVLQVARGHILR